MKNPPEELEAVLLARDGKRERGEIRFLCPAHDDHHPSARYHPEKRCWFCDACQAKGGWKDLCLRLGVPQDKRPRKTSAIVATYPYRDAAGELLYEVVRKASPKRFVQRRPNGTGGWVWNLKGVRRALYRLPEITVAVQQGVTVFVVEGEKDADTVADLGLESTTPPGGAGKWRSGYNESLRGGRVVVLADNDEAGRLHAVGVACELLGVADSVKLVHLPELPAKGDVSDWVEKRRQAGMGKEEIRAGLERLADETEPFVPPPSEEAGVDDSGGTGKKQRPSGSEILLQLVEDAGVELFHCPDRIPYASLPISGHRETWAVTSPTFRLWLQRAFYEETGQAAGPQTLQSALGVLTAQALFDGEKHIVSLRVGGNDERIFLDLGNEAWEVVEITAEGWRVVEDSPVKFRRTRAMLPLPRPVPGGSVEELTELVNLSDETSWILFTAFLVAALRPSGPYPALVLQGEQGSAKSSAARIARSLVDPAVAPLRTAPRDEHDLWIGATNGWVLALDNLSGISNQLSDALCRLATGGGLTTRQLYTDAEEVIFAAQRPVILNGIDDVVSRPDLADRSLILQLSAIPEEARRTEKELAAAFAAAQPRLLGALLDAVSCALRRQREVHLESKPRMADFASWVVAAEDALPWEPGAFLAAYTSNRSDAVELALEADAVAVAVRELVAVKGIFEGTAQDLLTALESRVGEGMRKSRHWPRSPRGLSGRLTRAATFLRQVGIEVVRPPREPGTGRRLIRLRPREIREDRDDRHLRRDRHESRNDEGSRRDGSDGRPETPAPLKVNGHTSGSDGAGVCDRRDDGDGQKAHTLQTAVSPVRTDPAAFRSSSAGGYSDVP
jgi:hypothetical protein